MAGKTVGKDGWKQPMNSPNVKINPPLTFFFGAMNYLFQAAFQNEEVTTTKITKFVEADTVGGRVKGTTHLARSRKPYRFFRGIPYAKPPVGKLRYEPPEPHPGWKGTLDCSWYRSECWQVPLWAQEQVPFGDEDCLHLNVATRRSYLKNFIDYVKEEDLRPVLVWIFGGMFMVGSANIYEPKYFMEHDIVYVSMNYRVNSFGFLNTGDGVVSGNMGLKDQTMALQWIQNNIKFFNGDPKRVVIMGESAGASSVHAHFLAPMSWGLFAGGISMSGTALSPWAIVYDAPLQAEEMAAGVGCPIGNTTRMIACMKGLRPEVLTRYHSGYMNDHAKGRRAMFGLTVDSRSAHGHQHQPFIPAHPLELMETGQINPNATWVYGVTSAEGVVSLIPVFKSDVLRTLLNSNVLRYLPVMMFYDAHPKRNQMAEETWQYYMNKQKVTQETLVNATIMASDVVFFQDSHQAAMLHAKVAPVYAYYYTYRGTYSAASLAIDTNNVTSVLPGISGTIGAAKNWILGNVFSEKPTMSLNLGICHGDDVPIIFNWPFLRKEIEAKKDVDYNFSNKLLGLWVTFAEDGKPKPRHIGENIHWPSVKESNKKLNDKPIKMLRLDQTFSLIKEPFYQRMQILNKYSLSKYPSFYKNITRSG